MALQLGQALLEKPSFGIGVDQLQGARVGGARLIGAVEPAQELGRVACRWW